MNLVDLALVLALLFFSYSGFGKSLYLEILELTSFLLAFFLSLRFYNLAATVLKTQLSLPHSFANVLGFIIVWYLVEIAFFIFLRVLQKKLPRPGSFPGERYLSIIPSLLRGVIFVSVILVLIGTFPVQPTIKNEVKNSKIGSLLLSQTYRLEGPLKNVFGGVAQDTLTFLTVQPKTSQRVNLGFKTSRFNFDERLESSMIDLVNKERIKNELPPLSFDPELREVARGHSGDMFKKGYFAHISPDGNDLGDRAKAGGVDFLVIGENLAFAPTLELAHNGLMNSPGHRANILSPDYNKIGVGAALSEDFGIMFTQVFKN